MNIGVFSYYYIPVINGVTLTIADWKRWGEKAGARFTIYIPKLQKTVHSDADVFEYPALSVFKKFGITIPMFPEIFVEKELKKRTVDVLHVHHPFYIGSLALYCKKKLGLPLVFTYHTRYSDYASTYVPWLPQQFVGAFVMRTVVQFINQCDSVTAANEALKQELITRGVRVPIFIVPPGVDTAKYSHGNRGVARKRFGFTTRDQILLYVGRLAKEKNIYFLLRAFVQVQKKIPHAKLLLAGNGSEEENLRTLVHRHGLDAKVVLATSETLQTIQDVYAAGDAFVYASQTETFGRVIVEAMAAGLPIIALRAPSIVDVLEEGRTGRIVLEDSPQRFAQTVIEVLRNTVQASGLGQRAQRVAQTEYDSSVSWQRLENVYRAVLR